MLDARIPNSNEALHAIGALIGKPWAFPDDPPTSYDCWTLVCTVRAHMSLTVPDMQRVSDLKDVPDTFLAARFDKQYVRSDIAKAKSGGILLMNWNLSHCGVLLGQRLVMHSHSADGQNGSVRVDPYNVLERMFGQIEVWHHVSDR